jgi:hypothetical protein
VEDARALDELTNDLTADHVLRDDSLDTTAVHPIIQRGHPARAWERRKPGAE